MRLAEFIRQHREAILAEWDAFAKTCSTASDVMDWKALRDHASEMLTVIADDLGTPQGKSAQKEKSRGNAPDDGLVEATAAEEHGAGRAESGFSVEEMISEYRALRASVIRLWTKHEGALETDDLEDLTRFNEAIDQSLAESVTRYTTDLGHSKEMFLAILGHDLRTPIGAVSMSAQFMLDTQNLQEPVKTLTSRMLSSSLRMNNLIGDLLDFTRSRLGGGIPIDRSPSDMQKVVQDAVDEIAAAHPNRTLKVIERDPERGEWDCDRISQALSNVISNALEHGSSDTTVTVEVAGDEQEVSIAIHNRGAAIPQEQLNGIFNPMKRREANGYNSSTSMGNLGLGLFIADRIVSAHNGRIAVKSTEEEGTTFTVFLPRGDTSVQAVEAKAGV